MRVFTVLGPSQSGKSTLAEALSRLDGRGSDFTLSEAVNLRNFTFLGDGWCAIDIAGGADNLATAGPALAASDAAVLCVPAEAEAAVLAAPYLRLIEEAGLPCHLFVNRMDTCTERVRDIVAALQTYCSHGLVLRQIPIREGGEVTGAVDLISERAWKYREGQASALIELPEAVLGREQEARGELLESLADFDDALLEQLIEDRRPATEEIYDLATRVEQHTDLIPVFLGAAGHGNGVTRLMKSLRHEAPGHESARARATPDGTETLAIGLAANIRKHLGKLTVIRALASGIGPGQSLGGGNLGALTALDAKTPLAELAPGEIGLAVKSDHLDTGHVFSAGARAPLPDWAAGRPPGYRRIIAPSHERDDARLSAALDRLVGIDPGLALDHDPLSGKAVLAFQGPLHARRVEHQLSADFGTRIEQSPVPPQYRETIARKSECHHRHRKQSGGAGQFADVVIRVTPQPRGAGFAFDETVKGGAVPRNYIPAVASGAGEALREGPQGYPVVDVGVTLLDGKHHAVDSSDHAFRTAGKNAVREALSEVGTKLLQPILHVDIFVPSVFAGGLVPTISGLKGQILGFGGDPAAAGWDIFSAQLPAATLDELFRALGSATRGTAWFVSRFDHDQEVSPDEVARQGAAEGYETA